MYNTMTIISEYTTETAAQDAKNRAVAYFPEFADRIGFEDTTDEWLNRESWGVTLMNGSNTECGRVWDFLWSNTAGRLAR